MDSVIPYFVEDFHIVSKEESIWESSVAHIHRLKDYIQKYANRNAQRKEADDQQDVQVTELEVDTSFIGTTDVGMSNLVRFRR